MTQGNTEGFNWFAAGGENYSLYRPHYPSALAAYLASIAPDNQRALDVGCGTGQLTRLLSAHFRTVIGVDPSKDQLENASKAPGVSYLHSPAENLPADIQDVNLITVAQAAHWFNLAAFYDEVRRVASPGAILALISYGVLNIEGAAGERFRKFYYEDIAHCWPPERQLVDSGYQQLSFPFAELNAPCLTIEAEWDFTALLGYISTWSAVRQAQQKGEEHIVSRFATELLAVWGDPANRKRMSWPVNMRIGKVAEKE